MPQKKTKEFINLSVKGYLEINDAYTLPIIDGASGYALTTDGLGNVTWQTSSTQSLSEVLLIGNDTGGTNINVNGTDQVVLNTNILQLNTVGDANNTLSTDGTDIMLTANRSFNVATAVGVGAAFSVSSAVGGAVVLIKDSTGGNEFWISPTVGRIRARISGSTDADLIFPANTTSQTYNLPADISGTIALTSSYSLDSVLANGDFTGANDIIMSTQSGNRLIKSDNATSSNRMSIAFIDGGASKDSMSIGDAGDTGGAVELKKDDAVLKVYDSTLSAYIGINRLSSSFDVGSTAGNYDFNLNSNITLKLQSPNGTANWATLKPTNLTANRIYTFQNASGTVAFLSDVQANDELSEVLANGNITGGTNITTSNGDVVNAASGSSILNLRDGADDAFTLSNSSLAGVYGSTTRLQASFGSNVGAMVIGVSEASLKWKSGSAITAITYDEVSAKPDSALSSIAHPFIIGDNLANIAHGPAVAVPQAVFINNSDTVTFNAGIKYSAAIATRGPVTVKTQTTLYTTAIALVNGINDSFEGLITKNAITSDQVWNLQDESGVIPVGPGWNTLIANPTITEDAYVISWDEGTGEYVLVPGATGTGTVTSIDFSGGTTGLTTTGGPVTASGTITLTGTLAESNGGTGQTTYATGDILYASGIGTLSKLSAGIDTQVLTLTGGVPTWIAPVTGGIYAGSGSLSTSTVVTMGAANLAFDTTSGDILFTNATGPNPLLLIDGTSGTVGIGGSVTLTESLSVYNQTGSGNDTALGIHNDNTTGTQVGLLIQVDGISSNNIALTLEADNAASNNYALVVPPNKGDAGFGTSTPDATVDIVGTLQYADGSEGAGKILESDASGNASWTAPKKTWTWGASRYSPKANLMYMGKYDGTPTNTSPYVAPFNCNITDITCSTSINATWTAEVHVNGIVAGSISVTAASTGIANGLSIGVTAGDLISFYCNGTVIPYPSIEAWFTEI